VTAYPGPEDAAYGLEAFGVIALAAYQPDPALFRRQLQSIRDQTVTAFRCIISADGDWRSVAQLVADITENDSRFAVIGFDDRQGFYGNFERALEAVPPDASWVALSDQDDYWYPGKLATLLPHLETNVLVAGQARVVRAAQPEVALSVTRRKNVRFPSLVVQNQFTGGQMVFRPSLLEFVLPFPRLETKSQVHDHWIAVVAAVLGHTLIVDDVVQDYVQHDANVLGEVSSSSPRRRVSAALDLAERYTGRRSAAGVVRAYADMSYGWRRTMVSRLAAVLPAAEAPEALRTPGSRVALEEAADAFGPEARWVPAARALLLGVARREVAVSCAVEYVVGFPSEVHRRRIMRHSSP
jgi:glycosyltransferase involved in cell wall biosynthesis